jgi:uncharacterized protein (DUF305 family)
MNKNIGWGVLILVLVFCLGYVTSTKVVTPAGAVQSGTHDMSAMNDAGAMRMAASLDGKKGEKLEVAFLEGMIVHHQDAVDMAGKLKAESKRPELQKLADDIINAQNSEIVLMKDWLNKWYGR